MRSAHGCHRFSLVVLALGFLTSMAGCVWLEEAVADKDHFSRDDRILGKWLTEDRVKFDVRMGDAATGIYELVDEDGEATPFRLLTINELLISTFPLRTAEKGEAVNLDAEKETYSALCQIGSDGNLRLFELNEQTTGKAVEMKQLKGTFNRRLFGRYSAVKATSAEDTRGWIKTHSRSLFERDPMMTLTPR